MFTLTKLGVTIDHVNIIDALSFTSPASGVVSILGPNGAGKSTLMKALAGGIAHHGEKCLNNAWPPSQQIAFMPQDYLVKSSLSVLDCVLLGQREHLSWRVSAAQKQRVVDTLERLSICHLRDRPMSSLSGGQQQLVLLAQRLSMTPRLLLLDEPTSALDLQHQLDVMALIRQYAQDTGALVLCSLHDLTLAARFSDHVVMLKQGKLIQHGKTQDVITQSTVRQVYNIECDLLTARDDKLIVAPYKATTSPRIASTF